MSYLFFRKQEGVATLGGYLYEIGGYDHGHRYDTVKSTILARLSGCLWHG